MSIILSSLLLFGAVGCGGSDSGRDTSTVDEDRRAHSAPASGPSFACDEVEPGSIEAIICKEDDLSALDRKLADVYAAAEAIATAQRDTTLKAEQVGWIKGRDDCWKSGDQRQCVRGAYTHRIAELQARFRLVPQKGPATYTCDDSTASEIVVTFFETDPPTLIARLGDEVSLMFLTPSASGSRYRGRNESFWEHHGEALVVWGYQATEMQCAERR